MTRFFIHTSSKNNVKYFFNFTRENENSGLRNTQHSKDYYIQQRKAKSHHILPCLKRWLKLGNPAWDKSRPQASEIYDIRQISSLYHLHFTVKLMPKKLHHVLPVYIQPRHTAETSLTCLLVHDSGSLGTLPNTWSENTLNNSVFLKRCEF